MPPYGRSVFKQDTLELAQVYCGITHKKIDNLSCISMLLFRLVRLHRATLHLGSTSQIMLSCRYANDYKEKEKMHSRF